MRPIAQRCAKVPRGKTLVAEVVRLRRAHHFPEHPTHARSGFAMMLVLVFIVLLLRVGFRDELMLVVGRSFFCFSIY